MEKKEKRGPSRCIVYSSIYSPFVHPLQRHLRRDGLVKDPLHICLCEYLWTCSSSTRDCLRPAAAVITDHDSVARRLLISCRLNLLGWSLSPPALDQSASVEGWSLHIAIQILTLRFTLLHNSQFRYMKYFCRKILDISTSLFSVENEILLPRPGDWDLVTTAATPRIFYYPAALGRGYPHICKN